MDNSLNIILAQTIRLIVLAAISFFVALIFTPFWNSVLKKMNLGKRIGASSGDAPIFSALHEKKAGTPAAGGVIIWGTVIFLALFFLITGRIFDGAFSYLNFVNRSETYLPLAALFIAAVLGLVDDWLGVFALGKSNDGGLKVRYKLIIYAILAVIGAWWFYFRLQWDVINIPFLGNFQIGPWYIPIFMFIIIASAFSANETDGLDGLFGGTALFAFMPLTIVAFVLHRFDLAAFGATIIGSLLAFLWFNIYPARFFMGDTGSMSLGITLGVVAMLTNTVLILPFFAIILVFESLSVIVQLTSKKIWHRKIFLSTPLHHHFEALGWPESQVTMRFWIISAISSALGLVIFFLSRLL